MSKFFFVRNEKVFPLFLCAAFNMKINILQSCSKLRIMIKSNILPKQNQLEDVKVSAGEFKTNFELFHLLLSFEYASV